MSPSFKSEISDLVKEACALLFGLINRGLERQVAQKINPIVRSYFEEPGTESKIRSICIQLSESFAKGLYR